MQVLGFFHQYEDQKVLQMFVDKANVKRLKYAIGNHEEVGKTKKLNRKIRKIKF
jgi:hypothetical protein